jgi:hypothetical protein
MPQVVVHVTLDRCAAGICEITGNLPTASLYPIKFFRWFDKAVVSDSVKNEGLPT